MTEEQFTKKLTGEFFRRLGEIERLVEWISRVPDPIRAAVVRACVVLLCAHLEGFIKRASRLLLEFLDKQGIIPSPLKEESTKGPEWWKHWLRDDALRIALHKVVLVLELDGGLPGVHREFIGVMRKRRNLIAHGEDVHNDVQIDENEFSNLARQMSEVLEYFREQITIYSQKRLGSHSFP